LGAIAAAVLGGCGVACALGDPIAPTPPDPRPDARSDAWPEPGGPGELAALAVRVDEGPRIDGVLDDAMWSLAAPSDDFRQADPVVGAEPSERTAFRVVYTETDLYIGVRCFVEAGGGTVLARQTRRDQGAQGDDSIFVSFDTNRDGQSGFFFEVGAAGARGDGLIDNDALLGRSWDGIWEARTSVDEGGWSAEIRIPFATFSFDSDLTAWGFNVSREMGRKRENVRWRNWRREGSVVQVSQAGLLDGLEDLRQGRGLTLRPFTSVITNLETNDIDVEVGADLFYRVTPQLTLALTVNTDFAEAEVDDRVVNLTRFPVFFPERRDFFLEDAGVFDFGGVRRSPRPFFSRRIGLVGGTQRGITAGARLTGRAGDWRIGAMTVQMDPDDELGDKNLSVLRLQRDVLESSNVGIIFTNGDPAGRGQNTLIGADFNYRNNNAFGGKGRITGDLFAQATRTDTVGVDDDNTDTSAIGGRFSINRDPWDFDVFVARIGEAYDPALGFVSRRGRNEYNVGGSYTWRFSEEESVVRNIRLRVNGNAFTYLNNTTDTVDINLPDLSVNFHSGEFLGARAFLSRDNLIEPFAIADGITVPRGQYDNTGIEARARHRGQPPRRGQRERPPLRLLLRRPHRLHGGAQPPPLLAVQRQRVLRDQRDRPARGGVHRPRLLDARLGAVHARPELGQHRAVGQPLRRGRAQQPRPLGVPPRAGVLRRLQRGLQRRGRLRRVQLGPPEPDHQAGARLPVLSGAPRPDATVTGSPRGTRRRTRRCPTGRGSRRATPGPRPGAPSGTRRRTR
jgi:hypothetical protein